LREGKVASLKARTQTANTRGTIWSIAEIIGQELYLALANYELFAPSGDNLALIERVNDQQIHEGFNVISEALQFTVIATLCRIWDKTSDTARMAEVAKKLQKHPEHTNDLKELKQWLSDVERVETRRSLRRSEASGT
jgi:AbiU2